MRNILAALAVVTAASAFNANALEYKPYIGIDYNYVDLSSSSANFNAGTINIGTSYNDYFGTEIFFQKSDHANVGGNVKTDFQAYGIDAYGYLPMDCYQEWNLVGTVGIANYDIDSNKIGSDNGYGYRIGAGVQYNIDEKMSVRAIARHIDFENVGGADHLMEWALGARYSF